ncbi:unnamed protein product [Schistosoma margrebowiei]|uniref:Uncharacterized protein n=1 Tax=Schistosoma margrebowiei TaxID=48269 RepID=A0A183M186_9TREM|nr:unnamed protein product [Schistosoma margrebowiei]
MQQDDSDFADNLALLTHKQQQMQKTTSVAAASAAVGSMVDEHGGSHADVKVRIVKARASYLQMKNIWNSKQLPTDIKF